MSSIRPLAFWQQRTPEWMELHRGETVATIRISPALEIALPLALRWGYRHDPVCCIEHALFSPRSLVLFCIYVSARWTAACFRDIVGARAIQAVNSGILKRIKTRPILVNNRTIVFGLQPACRGRGRPSTGRTIVIQECNNGDIAWSVLSASRLREIKPP